MVIFRIKLSDSNSDLLEIEKYIKIFSIMYVKSFFKSHFKKRNDLKVLKNIEKNINNIYNIKINIKDLIISLLCHLKIDNKGFLKIPDYKIKNIKAIAIYQLITFGNLSNLKSNIFQEAVLFGIKNMRLRKIYGY